MVILYRSGGGCTASISWTKHNDSSRESRLELEHVIRADGQNVEIHGVLVAKCFGCKPRGSWWLESLKQAKWITSLLSPKTSSTKLSDVRLSKCSKKTRWRCWDASWELIADDGPESWVTGTRWLDFMFLLRLRFLFPMGQGQVGQADSVHAFLCLSISSIFFVVFLVLVLSTSQKKGWLPLCQWFNRSMMWKWLEMYRHELNWHEMKCVLTTSSAILLCRRWRRRANARGAIPATKQPSVPRPSCLP